MKLPPKCGKCQHIGYCDALSEWECEKYNVLLGYSLQPYKCRECDVIGQDGDVRLMRAMFDLLESFQDGL